MELIQESRNKSPFNAEPSIYRVPPPLRQGRESFYTPTVLRIGPLHWGNQSLIFMEDYKKRLLGRFFDIIGLEMVDRFATTIQENEDQIRSCYDETIPLTVSQLVDMIVLDSCFIFWFFSKGVYGTYSVEDKKVLKEWRRDHLVNDLLLLENQLPFFILSRLYNMAFKNDFSRLVYSFFKDYRVFRHVEIQEVEDVSHFLDMVRMFWLPAPHEQNKALTLGHCSAYIAPATQLDASGVKFKPVADKGLFHLEFNKGALGFTTLDVEPDSEIRVLNLMAYEQCHYMEDPYNLTQYMRLLDLLVNTEADVDLLVKHGMVKNYCGDSTEVAKMINRLGKNIIIPGINSHYCRIFDDVHRFSHTRWRMWKAELKRKYPASPWTINACVVGIVLLVLQITQTLCSIYRYANHEKGI